MNGPQHYRAAEELLDRAVIKPSTQQAGGLHHDAAELIAAAHVHAALAQVHAAFTHQWTTMPSGWLDVFRAEDEDTP
jgi:hypothetical protein